MYIRIYLFGKQNKSSLKDLQEKYLILLSKWNVSIVFLKESKVGEVKDKQKADFETLVKNLDSNYIPVLLDERGKFPSSVEFSQFLDEKAVNSEKLAFCLGGPFGFREEDKNFFKYKIGLSKMTLTHEMAEIILLEQLYRSFTILNNKKYHY